MTLKFNKSDHTYWVNGKRVLGVNEILNDNGLIVRDGAIPQAVLDKAAHRGEQVHLACQYFDLGILNEDTLTEEIKPYFKAYKSFLSDHKGLEIIDIEKKEFNEESGHAGTIDRNVLYQTRNILVDLKCVSVVQDHYRYQTAGYVCLKTPVVQYERWIVQLLKTGKYRIYEHNNDNDKYLFSCALTLSKHRRKGDTLWLYSQPSQEASLAVV